MTSTRQRALTAAIDLVGQEGVRSLTHGRVDAAASLPAGSTSNHFRTRAALVSGVIERIAEAERADAEVPVIRSRDDLVSALVRMIEVQSGANAIRTRARYALFLEADEESVQPLRAQRLHMEAWVRSILDELGGARAQSRTPFLMALAEGVILHRLTVDPDAPVEPSIACGVDAALAG